MRVPDISQDATYQEAERLASSFLESIGENPQEARWLLLERNGWNLTEWLLNVHKKMPQAVKMQFQKDLNRKAQKEPLQYILGEVEFLGEKYQVSPATLIPRPETEWWLEKALAHLNDKKGLRVLDIGTGSGVIAISHKLQRPQDEVVATDISRKALAVAQENAKKLKADINFGVGDLFEPVKGQTFDVIYSNPPYIGREEWSEVDAAVLAYEPHEALFAEEAGYALYRQIAEQFSNYLTPNGQLFLEIGYKQTQKVTTFFEEVAPAALIECWRDLYGKDRLIHVKWI